MKKLIVGLLMATLVSLGLVGSTTTPATAVDCIKYTSCIKGKLRVNKINKIRVGKKQRIRVRITLPGDGAAIKATGRVRVKVVKIGGGNKRYFSGGTTYTGVPVFFFTDPLTEPGRYLIKAKFIGDQPFGDLTNNKKKFVVKR